MSIIIGTVQMGEIPEIKEYFLGFIEAWESTGLSLLGLILERLSELNINFDDCRGQSYENGANMKGKNKGSRQHVGQVTVKEEGR